MAIRAYDYRYAALDLGAVLDIALFAMHLKGCKFVHGYLPKPWRSTLRPYQYMPYSERSTKQMPNSCAYETGT